MIGEKNSQREGNEFRENGLGSKKNKVEEEIWGDERGAPSPPRPHIRGSDFSTPWWRSLRLSRFSFTFPCREKSERKRIGGEAAS